MRCGMERDNRDEDMMLKGTKQEMPGFYFRLLRSEEKRELWNQDFASWDGKSQLRGRRGSQSPGEICLCDQPVSDL